MTDKISFGNFSLDTENLKEILEKIPLILESSKEILENTPLILMTGLVAVTCVALCTYCKPRPTARQIIKNSTLARNSVVTQRSNSPQGDNAVLTQEVDGTDIKVGAQITQS